MEGVRVRAGVDLADRRADALGRFDLLELGIDEDRDHDARVGQPLHHAEEPLLLGDDVQPALGGDLVPALGHQHRHLRLDARGERHHLVGSGHLEVQADVGELAQAPHILVLDVAAVLAQVHGDAVGAAQMRLHRRPDGVGLVRAPRLAHRSHMVDIDGELNHRSLNSRRTARVWSTCPCSRSPMSARIRVRASSRVAGSL
jgi:hypothetical protein